MELTVIGKPYAKAIADIAQNDQSFEAWKQLLTALSLIIEDEATQEYISAPSTSNEQIIRFLTSTLEAIGVIISEKQANFISLLIANNRIFAVPDMLVQFQSMNASSEKTITVQSAYALSKEELADISTQLSNAYNTKISIAEEVNSSLHAGIIIKDGDKVVDLSVVARAEALAARLSI